MAPIVLAAAMQTAILPLLSPPVLRATVDANCVYTCGVCARAPGSKWTFGGGRLWLERMDLKQKAEIASLEFFLGIHGRRNALLRWQLIDNKYYCIAYHLPWDDFRDLVSREGNIAAVPLAAIELVNASRKRLDFQDYWKSYEKSFETGPDLNPVGRAIGIPSDSIKRQIFFDFWCRGDKQFEMYVTGPRQANRLTRHDFHAERTIRADQASTLQWDQIGEWTFDWTGPFYVAAIGDDRYFVTDTGRVFLAPRAAKPGMPLKELWKGPPVDALIHDSDAKTWYAFTKDQFFEIADPIKPKPHTIPIRRAWTADEAVVTAAKCGRVIRSLPAPPMTERTWDELASPELRIGHNAVWAMTNDPARAVALLKDRLQPVPLPPTKELAALIDELGAEAFAKREAAQKRLREFGHTIEPIVREAATMTSTAEATRRLRELLAAWQRADSRTPDEVRAGRAVRVLERIGTPDARRLLQEWAKGADAAVLTREARTALHQSVGKSPGSSGQK